MTPTGAPRAVTAVERRVVDGVLLLDKPSALSSNAALQRVRRALGAKKAGHTGTLDPLASGLLPICLGEATKFSQGLTDSVKVYRTDVTLGITTATGDAEGRVLESKPVACSLGQIEAALVALRGDILQVPHRYSALKRDGRALYEYARAGEEVAIAARPVRIEELAVEAWEPPVLTLRVRCSKGTYVRSLAESIGDALGCGAHVSALRRLAVGGFDVGDAVTLDVLEAMSASDRVRQLQPYTVLIGGLPRIVLSAVEANRFRHGLGIPLREPTTAEPDRSLAVFAEPTEPAGAPAFVGLGRVTSEGGVPRLVPQRLLVAGHGTGGGEDAAGIEPAGRPPADAADFPA